jgi:hypothetical protein
LLGNGGVNIPLLLLGNSSVKSLPWQQYTRNIRKIVGRVFFHAVGVVWGKVGD